MSPSTFMRNASTLLGDYMMADTICFTRMVIWGAQQDEKVNSI